MEVKFSLKQFVLSMFLLLTISSAVSADEPLSMLKNVTSNVMDELRGHRVEIHQDRKKLYALVDHLILPHVDFTEMARWVVGRNAWRQASPETQEAFIKAFRDMVVRSYARSLLEYTDQEIEFLPIREAAANQERVQVSSLIKDGSQITHMNYYLLNEGGTWRVYDIVIEGVSLVQGYRAQFADDIRTGGVAKTVETMRRHNESNSGENTKSRQSEG